MAKKSRSSRHIGWGTTTLAVGAAVTALTAPSALADVGPIGVLACPPTPTGTPCATPGSYAVGQAYTISTSYGIAYGLDGVQVNIYVDAFDNGACIAGTTATDIDGIHDYTHITWVPTTPGTHKIRVIQGSDFADTTVTVVAAPAGSISVTPPAQAACHGDGTISGSAALPKIVLPSLGSSQLFPTGSGTGLFPTGSASRR
ncbi:hypothetical protein ACFV4K_10630 [Nocardia sp. NPDC059764]|uniref:hypothetical protein n=1 Tax=Nocardia sp. NPDC059764 TaxID=3346939 RepID=UPI003667D4D9